MHKDLFIDDFTDLKFREAFCEYFDELLVAVKDWDSLFSQMENDGIGRNYAVLRLDESGEIIAFIMFCKIKAESSFFSCDYGFIREFWVKKAYRGMGHGRELLFEAEKYFLCRKIRNMILTSDTAEGFYIKCGYFRNDGVASKKRPACFYKIFEIRKLKNDIIRSLYGI